MKMPVLILLFSCLLPPCRASVESEPNNSAAQANSLTLGTVMNGQLSMAADQDWFSLTVPQAMVIDLVFDSPYNSSSETLEYHAVHCETVAGVTLLRFGAAADRSFRVSLPSAGTYRFWVEKGTGSLVTQQYGLTLSASSGAAELEPNSAAASATPLQIGAATSAQMSGAGDQDWFRITTASAATATIVFDSPANAVTPSLEYHVISVVNSAGDLLSRVGTAKDTEFSVSLAAAGTYHLYVTVGEDATVTSSYVITVTGITPIAPPTLRVADIQPAVVVRWLSVQGKAYSIQRTGSLTAPNWLPVAGPFPGTGLTMQQFDVSSLPRAFYRVVEQ